MITKTKNNTSINIFKTIHVKTITSISTYVLFHIQFWHAYNKVFFGNMYVHAYTEI